MSYDEIFASFAALAAAVPFVTEWLKNLFKATGTGAQIISWVTGLLMAVIAYVLNLGIFADASIWQSLLIGFGASLAANGIFDIGVVTWVLQLLGIIKTNKPQEDE